MLSKTRHVSKSTKHRQLAFCSNISPGVESLLRNYRRITHQEGHRMDYAVIMAGGSGTRLWPLSRENQPKQALKLIHGRSMFQHAIDRIAPLFPPERIFVVTRAEHAKLLHAQTPELPQENFILEPEGRNTAPAVGLAAIHLRRQDEDSVMAVLTADHFIADTEGFREAIKSAISIARENHLVTLGIQPTHPATGYGYIQMGEKLKQEHGLPIHNVDRFVEKPDLDRAISMVTSGNYVWNSGMFVWKTERILSEFAVQMPEFHKQLNELSAGLVSGSYPQVIERIWPDVEKKSIDYGVMENAQSTVVIPIQVGWADIGSWVSLEQLLPTDDHGNAWTGPHVDIDTRNTLVFMEKPRLAALIGIEGLVIVDTEDALLICPKEREQEVRDVVKRLQDRGENHWL
jgi:mannose-1-phosphate guanylyltransferase